MYHSIISSSFSPTSRLIARRVSKCSAPQASFVSPKHTAPPCLTSRSEKYPTTGFAVIPEKASDPPPLQGGGQLRYRAGDPFDLAALADQLPNGFRAIEITRVVPPLSCSVKPRRGVPLDEAASGRVK